MEIKTIAILGCGWYGMPMAKALLKNGFKVKGSTTTASKLNLLANQGIEPYLIDTENKDFNQDFFKCDLLLISIPPKVNSGQLSYPQKISNIASAAENAGVKQVILISSTGIYQDGNFIVNEAITPQPNTPVGTELLAAEQLLKDKKSFGSTVIRFAGLIGPDRNLAKHFAGKTDIANGLAPINLIHLTDCIGLSKAIIDQKAFGKTYHGVTPNHPKRMEFYTKACEVAGFEKPTFKEELLNWKQIESKNVPEVLAYRYVFDNWDSYLALIKP